jgi:hypothetical protein
VPRGRRHLRFVRTRRVRAVDERVMALARELAATPRSGDTVYGFAAGFTKIAAVAPGQ